MRKVPGKPFAPGHQNATGTDKPPGKGVLRDRLTAAQDLFCREYAVDLDGPRAAQAAWPGMKARYSASAKACHLLAMPKIQARIAELKAAQFKRLDMKGDDVLLELMRVASIDPAGLYDENGDMLPVQKLPQDLRRCVASVEFDAAGRQKVKFWNKMEALTMLARHFKVCVERVEVKGVGGVAERLALARQRAAGARARPPADPSAAPGT